MSSSLKIPSVNKQNSNSDSKATQQKNVQLTKKWQKINKVINNSHQQKNLQISNTKDKIDPNYSLHSQMVLNTLMRYMPEGITVADIDGNIIQTSHYAQRILGASYTGLTSEQIIKKWKVYHRDGKTLMRHDNLPLIKALHEDQVIRNLELIQLNSKGKKLILQCNAAPIKNKDNKILGAIITWSNISKRKKIENELKVNERKYRKLFQKMTDGFALHEIVLDKRNRPYDYIFLDVNPAFEKLTGLNRQTIVGQRVSEILPDEVNKWVKIYGNVAKTGKSVHIENYSPTLKKHFEIFAFSPKIGQFATLFTDITQRKEEEKNKDNFFNIASHELKTPLTSLKAFTQILQQKMQNADNPEISWMLSRIDAQANKLTNLVVSLLDINKMQANKMIYEKDNFDIGILIKEVVADIKTTIGKKPKIVVNITSSDVVYADRFRICQVLTNLLTNAIKYSSKDKKIIVSVFSKQHFVIISVKDFGIGIAPDKINEVFKRFYRINPVQTQHDQFASLGLGLYIASEIIKRHKGKMWVDSELGKGSTFYFKLPKKDGVS